MLELNLKQKKLKKLLKKSEKGGEEYNALDNAEDGHAINLVLLPLDFRISHLDFLINHPPVTDARLNRSLKNSRMNF